MLSSRPCVDVNFSKELFYVSPLTVKRGTVHPAIIETHIHEFTYCVPSATTTEGFRAFRHCDCLKCNVIVVCDMLQATLCLTTLRLLCVGVLTNMWLVTIS